MTNTNGAILVGTCTKGTARVFVPCGRTVKWPRQGICWIRDTSIKYSNKQAWLPFLLAGASADTLQVAAAWGTSRLFIWWRKSSGEEGELCISYFGIIPSAWPKIPTSRDIPEDVLSREIQFKKDNEAPSYFIDTDGLLTLDIPNKRLHSESTHGHLCTLPVGRSRGICGKGVHAWS